MWFNFVKKRRYVFLYFLYRMSIIISWISREVEELYGEKIKLLFEEGLSE